MKKVLIIVNHDVSLYTFRLEIIQRLLKEGHEVHIASPKGEYVERIVALGTYYHETQFDRHGKNALDELRLLKRYRQIMKSVMPDIVFGYTIKPNIYGAIAAKSLNIPFVANITGLGTAVETPGMMQKVLLGLYKFAFRDVRKVFFQNEANRALFLKHGIGTKANELLPGSGVSLERFQYAEYPAEDTVKFAFISRIMKEKGIEHYLEAAKLIAAKYDNVEFHVCGFCEPEYEGNLELAVQQDVIKYHGMITDVNDFMKGVHAVVHPTYYPEGLSNVLLESCATGRPIITTDRSGCREVVEDGENGFVVKEKDTETLVEAIETFISLPWEKKREMGKNARQKVEKEFSREIVVEKYLFEVNSL